MIKPGIKTSEFVLTLAAVIVAALIGSGLFVETHWVAQALSVVGIVLSALGYNAGRAKVKAVAELGRARENPSGD